MNWLFLILFPGIIAEISAAEIPAGHTKSTASKNDWGFCFPFLGIATAGNPSIQVEPEADLKSSVASNRFSYFIDASFTYWRAKEEGLSLAENALLNPSGVTIDAPNSEVLKASTGYNPGFKVGIGMGYLDFCELQAEYTYYRGVSKTSKAAPQNTTDVTAVGVWNLDTWYLQLSPVSYQSLTGTNLSATWKLSMDLSDLMVRFPFKKKRGLSFSPFAGLRALWLRQHMNLSLVQAGASVGGSEFLPSQPLKSWNSSNSWGIGPRLGVQGKCGLPVGLRVESLLAVSLLYTDFTSVKHYEQKAATYLDFPLKTHMDNHTCVRPIVDLSLGIGWGMKMSNKYDLDLALSYDFSYFWNQNMMRTMLDEYFDGSASGGLDLYFQGIEFTASFKF